jgi:hypothetical protein
LNEEDKDVAAEAAETEAAETNEANAAAAATPVPATPQPLLNQTEPRNNSVKRVLMPIDSHGNKSNTTKSAPAKTSVNASTQPDDRPRRAHEEHP